MCWWEVESGWLERGFERSVEGRDHMGQAAAPFTALLPMTPRIPGRSEPDSSCFVSFTLFSLLLEGQFCFVVLFWFFFFFYNVIDCHVQVLFSS